MKKKLFFAAVVATALAGCSSNENLENDLANVANPVAQDGRVPIVLGLTSNDVQVLKTRGTGTVGDIAGAPGVTNIYRNEDLWVLMTATDPKTSTWGYTAFDETTVPPIIGTLFDGTFKARPYGYDAATGGNKVNVNPTYDGVTPTAAELANASEWGLDYLSYNGNKTKYYRMDGTPSDFFAFHIDDAFTGTAGDYNYDVPTIQDGTLESVDAKYIEFEIDGSQDLLAGKADNWSTGVDDNIVGFTAKKARAGLVPVIPMKHLLTRLTFQLVPGHKDAEGVTVKSLTIKDAKNAGKVYVAYNKTDGTVIDPENLIEWSDDANDIADFELKKVPTDISYNAVAPAGTEDPSAEGWYEEAAGVYTASADNTVDVGKTYYERVVTPNAVNDPNTGEKNLLVSVDPNDDNDFLAQITAADVAPANVEDFTSERIGDALFVQPNQTQFECEAILRFPITGYAQPFVEIPYTFYIRRTTGNPATVVENGLEIGQSYNVQIKVYGLSEVFVRTTLTPWTNGGDIVIDTDDPTNTWEQLPAPAPAAPTYSAVAPTGTEDPSAEGWYEFDGVDTYTPTADTTVDANKTYYKQD